MEYRQFYYADEANDWLLSNYEKFLMENQNNAYNVHTLGYALFCYTGSMSKNYNDYLFNANGIVEKINIKDDFYGDTLYNIKLISETFNINQVVENVVLYHYLNYNPKDLIQSIRNNKNIFCFKRFVSTTLLPNCLGMEKLKERKRYNILFKINVPRGTPCIPILWSSKQSILSEYEIILSQNLKLVLLKIKKRWFSKIKYELEFNVII